MFILDYSVQLVYIEDRSCARTKTIYFLDRKLIFAGKIPEKLISSTFFQCGFQSVIFIIFYFDLRFAKRERIGKKVDVS